MRLELLGKLNAIPGIDLSRNVISKRPSIGLEVLAQGSNLDQFLRVFEWFIEEIKSA